MNVSRGRAVTRTIFGCHSWAWAALVLLASLLACASVRADETEDAYLNIYSTIQQGDKLATAGQAEKAAAKYREAQAALTLFQRDHRDWNPNMVNFRLKDLADKLAPKEAAKPTESATPSTGTAKPAAGGSSTAVNTRIIEAGVEPRKALRLHPKAGDSQTLAMTVQLSVETKMAGMDTPAMKMPSMTITVQSTVKELADSGDITYGLEVADATAAADEGVLAPMLEGIRKAMEGLKGLTGTCVVTSRGINKSAELKAPASADAQARQMVEQMREAFSRMALVLPEEAVGPGAKWEVKQKIKSQGIAMDDTSVCELSAVEGDIVKIASTSNQSASRQKVENPSMPGMKVDLEKMSGKGSGSFTCNLAQLMISEGTINNEADMVMSLDLGGQKQSMTVKTTTKVLLSTK